jgi:hypothetical protein
LQHKTAQWSRLQHRTAPVVLQHRTATVVLLALVSVVEPALATVRLPYAYGSRTHKSPTATTDLPRTECPDREPGQNQLSNSTRRALLYRSCYSGLCQRNLDGIEYSYGPRTSWNRGGVFGRCPGRCATLCAPCSLYIYRVDRVSLINLYIRTRALYTVYSVHCRRQADLSVYSVHRQVPQTSPL